MLRLNLDSLVLYLTHLQRIRELLPLRDVKDSDLLLSVVSGAQEACSHLPLHDSVSRQFDRLKYDIRRHPLANHANAIDTLQEEIVAQLKEHAFFSMRPDLLYCYDGGSKLFGDDVETAFPLAGQEIAAFGRCYSFEQWTAAVFHLMRTIEIGLRELAVRLQVPLTDREQMNTVIESCRAKLKTSPPPKDTRDYYDEALAYLEASKNAWRNHVAHATVTYDEAGARSIMQSVESFMKQLSKPTP